MKFRVYRYDPESDAKPYYQDYDVTLEHADRMLLDALMRIKQQDDTLSFRRSCREMVTSLPVEGHENDDVMAQFLERLRQRPAHIAESPGLRDRRHLRRCEDDLHRVRRSRSRHIRPPRCSRH